MPEPQCFVFGAFQLDLRDERLWCGPEVVRLPPKPFAVLACLVTQAGRLVTKDALLAAVWPDTVVSEDVLTATMRQLRRVLGDQSRPPQFIETVHGRGYRFIAPVQAPASLGCQLPTIFALECLGICYGREIPVSVLRSPPEHRNGV